MRHTPKRTLFGVMTDFLITRPTTEEIIAYRLPDDLEKRAHELLERNGEGGLTAEEREEMKDYMFVETLMSLLKAKVKAKRKINSGSV